MTYYSENAFHLNGYYFVFKWNAVSRIKSKFSEINLFYKYLTQKLVNEGKILIKLQKITKQVL